MRIVHRALPEVTKAFLEIPAAHSAPNTPTILWLELELAQYACCALNLAQLIPLARSSCQIANVSLATNSQALHAWPVPKGRGVLGRATVALNAQLVRTRQAWPLAACQRVRGALTMQPATLARPG